jgi:glutaredoxin
MKSALLLTVVSASLLLAGGGPVPRKAPYFVIQADSKNGFGPSQYPGIPVIMVFVLTDCSHCEFTANLLNGIEKDYSGRVRILASAIDEHAATEFAAFHQKHALNFPLGYNTLADAVHFLGYAPGEVPMPVIAFIDRNGIIRAQFDGKDKEMVEPYQDKNFRIVLDQLIKEGQTASPPSAPKEKKTP